LDGIASLPLGYGEIELCLQVHPKLPIGLQLMAKRKHDIASDPALTLNDLCEPIGRHVDLPGEFS